MSGMGALLVSNSPIPIYVSPGFLKINKQLGYKTQYVNFKFVKYNTQL